MTPEQLTAIKERVAKATPGRWSVRRHTDGTIDVISVETTEHNEYLARIELGEIDDATFIANARQDIPALVAEVERLKSILIGVEGDLRNALADYYYDTHILRAQTKVEEALK